MRELFDMVCQESDATASRSKEAPPAATKAPDVEEEGGPAALLPPWLGGAVGHGMGARKVILEDRIAKAPTSRDATELNGINGVGSGLEILGGLQSFGDGNVTDGIVKTGKGGLGLANLVSESRRAPWEELLRYGGDTRAAGNAGLGRIDSLQSGLAWGGRALDVLDNGKKIYDGFNSDDEWTKWSTIGQGGLGLAGTGFDIANSYGVQGVGKAAPILGMLSGGLKMADGIQEASKHDGDVDVATQNLAGGYLGISTGALALAGLGAAPVAAIGVAGAAGLEAGAALRKTGNESARKHDIFGNGSEHLDRRFDKHNTDNSVDGQALRAGAWVEDQIDDVLPSWTPEIVGQGGGALAAGAAAIPLTIGAASADLLFELGMESPAEERARLAAERRAKASERDDAYVEHRARFGKEAMSQDEFEEQYSRPFGAMTVDLVTQTRINQGRAVREEQIASGEWTDFDQQIADEVGVRLSKEESEAYQREQEKKRPSWLLDEVSPAFMRR